MREGQVAVHAREGSSPNSIRLEVQDSGEGLTEEQQQSLWTEPKSSDSTGPNKGSANLALYVVKLLVELQVHPRPHSTYIFPLPLRCQAPGGAPGEETPCTALWGPLF